jgi:hypothetical protein
MTAPTFQLRARDILFVNEFAHINAQHLHKLSRATVGTGMAMTNKINIQSNVKHFKYCMMKSFEFNPS